MSHYLCDHISAIQFRQQRHNMNMNQAKIDNYFKATKQANSDCIEQIAIVAESEIFYNECVKNVCQEEMCLNEKLKQKKIKDELQTQG